MPDCIVSDTSCLILLKNIGDLDLLKRLYERITITPEVADEYGLQLPDWFDVMSPATPDFQLFLENYPDKGESSAIALAFEMKECLVVLDDYNARKIAEQLNLRITGTLGILIKAKQKGIIPSLILYIEKLKKVNFRISEALISDVLRQAGESREKA